MVLPVRQGNAALVQDFETYFTMQIFEFVPFTTQVFRRAAEIRAHLGFRTPDSLHLAAAVEASCDVFLTNDVQLARFAGIAVEVV
jgi:predicted nucleic acid-binding protein